MNRRRNIKISWRAVYEQFLRETTAALHSQLLAARPTPIYLAT